MEDTILIFGSELVFGASLDVGIPYFVLSIILSIAVIFPLGLVVAALVPSQSVASGVGGGLTFLLFFLAGLWIPPATVGGPFPEDYGVKYSVSRISTRRRPYGLE